MNTIQEKYIDTNGLTTHYWEVGEGEPLILIHGGGAGADAWINWRKLLERYSKNGFRTIAYDLIGYGESSKPDPENFKYDHEARAEQLISFIKALGLEKVSLIGNSLGGATSIVATLKEPDKINKLVLMGTGGRRRPGETSASFKSLHSFGNERDEMRQIIRNLTNPEFEIEEEMIEYRLKLANDPETSKAYSAIMKYLKEGNSFIPDEEIKKIKHKTLLVHGRNDNQVPVEKSFELEKLIENAWLYVIPHCGHWAMIERTDEFIKLTTDFLKNY
ncbi:alpha/beta hydrolase [Pueribacillus theae]|uniref:Alpha/beta hydrolase n=1 Tax=Pueribacillus theae TaxID=2171751 RepID=A0A2U1K355_9BACI|nr:alpha/beta hydrolase [Pueribacillus theae]PWA11967.1 alpha/beta hydrolase [Pueribacillus theae]